MIIKGKFDVTLAPIDSYAEGKNGIDLGRMSIDKKYHGELSASSTGEMLSAIPPTHGSAGYVAIEQVDGKLGGKRGSFVLQHFGIMNDGNNRLILEVVPNSGTGELSSLSGTMTIDLKEEQHYYEFDYSL